MNITKIVLMLLNLCSENSAALAYYVIHPSLYFHMIPKNLKDGEYVDLYSFYLSVKISDLLHVPENFTHQTLLSS